MPHRRTEGQVADRDEAIFAHRPHRHDVGIVPAEHAAVKGVAGVLIGSDQLVPVALAHAGALISGARCVAVAAHDVEGDALRIGDHRHAADPRHGPRAHMHRSACGLDRIGSRIGIVYAKVEQPAGPRPARCHLGRQPHHPADRAVPGFDHAVIHFGSGLADRPADDVIVERFRRGRVDALQLVPDRGAVWVGHGALLSR